MLVNADRSAGPDRLLFAVNPAAEDVTIPVGAAVAASGPWRQLADHDRFYPRARDRGRVAGRRGAARTGCGLWLASALG